MVSVPGAFTPGCQAFHLPPYIQKIGDLKSKGVDKVAVIASNDEWVMNAWGKVNKVNTDDIVSSMTVYDKLEITLTHRFQLMLSDTKTFFSKEHGWAAGMGDRNGRWAMIIEKDGSISYAENEKSPAEVNVSTNNGSWGIRRKANSVQVSGADAILSRL